MSAKADIVVQKIRVYFAVILSKFDSLQRALHIEVVMKKIRRVLLAAVFAIILALGAVCFTACGDKNDDKSSAPLYKFTLKLNAEQVWEEFIGKEGASITLTKDSPVRANANFKGWSLSIDGDVVSLPTVMPKGGATYYAVFTRYYNLSLRPNGGTLTDNTNIRADVGQSLYSIVKDIVPTAPGNSTFDGWYYGNNKIDENSTIVMPANAVSLDAKYTVDYTINIFKQNDYSSDDYTKVIDDTVVGNGFVGSSPRASEYPSYAGYEYNDEKSGSTYDFVLSATSGNVFNAYYDIQSYKLVFNVNTPTGATASGSMGALDWGYNVENTIPDCDYVVAGYRFSHWSTTADGSDRIDVGDTYSISNSTTLYAVWTRGYADITGRSYDYIFLIEDDDGNTVAYLERPYLDELEGTYDNATHTVSFSENGRVILCGKLDSDSYIYTYIKTDEYVLHALADMSDARINGYIDDTVKLALSADGTAVYTEDGTAINGTYVMDADEQSMKFSAIDVDKMFFFRLSQFTTDTGNEDVFEIRSDAEVGEWCRLTDDYAFGSDYADESFVLELNGYGEAVMHAKGGINKVSYNYSGYYRYAASVTSEKLEIYTVFITSYDSAITRMVLVDRTETADQDAQYKKFYKEFTFSTIAYAKPADGGELDDETAVTLDGYGLYADSAKFADDTTSMYTLNWINRTLTLGDTTYFVDIHTVGEGDEAKAYLVYEPMQQGKDEFDKLYAISGLESKYRPGGTYAFRFYNDNVGVLYIAMPDVNSVFNTINASLQPVIEGTYTSLGHGQYLFQADISDIQIALIKYYFINLYGNSVGLDISSFGDFKFKFTGADKGEVTALGDGYAGISLVDNGATYVTDGYGKANVTNAQGIITDTRDYTVVESLGLPCLFLVWKETELDINNNPKEVSKQITYTLIDGEYREYIDEYGKHNTQYSSAIPDTTFSMAVYEGDYAVLSYYIYLSPMNIQTVMYSWGKVTWADSDKKFGSYEECGVINHSGDILTQFYGDFKFGLKEVTVIVSGKETKATRLYTYDAPTSDVIDGKYVINGEGGATLTVDISKGEAEYSVTDSDGVETTVSGEFKLREGILSIVYAVDGEDGETYVRSNAFKLIYDNGNITSFIEVGVETGTWTDMTGVNGSIVLSGVQSHNEGEYIGIWYGYDRATGEIVEIEGTYARTDNEEIVEYVFKYKTEPDETVEGDKGDRSFNFILGYDAMFMPVYRIYSIPVYVVLYSSITSAMPSYMLRGGGYSDLVLLDTYSNETVGQLLIYPNANLLLDNAGLYAFGTNEIEPRPLFFFTIMGEGENMRGIMLDGTFASENFGRFEYEGDRELTVPVRDADSGKYHDEKIVPDRIFFNGLGMAMLIDTKTERALPATYLRYNTNTYAFVSIEGENINIIALVRLYTSTSTVTDDNGEETTETRYIVRFDDAEIRRTFKGEGHTAFITDGFDSATYADELGVLHACTFKRMEDHPEVLELTYLNGLSLAYMYIEVDTEDGTFTVLDADDSRIPQDTEQDDALNEDNAQ